MYSVQQDEADAPDIQYGQLFMQAVLNVLRNIPDGSVFLTTKQTILNALLTTI